MGAPVSGALSLVGSITAGIAAGLVPSATPRRHGRVIAAPSEDHVACPFTGARLLSHLALSLAPGLAGGRYLGHWTAEKVTIYQGACGIGSRNTSSPCFSLSRPVLLFTSSAIILYSDIGLTPVLVMALAGAEHALMSASLEVSIFAAAASPANKPAARSSALVVAQLQRHVWLDFLPSLRCIL